MPPRRRLALVLLAISLAILAATGLLEGAQRLAGRALLPPDRAGAVLPLGLAFGALFLLLAGLAVLRARWWLFPLALLAWWLGVETFASPHLSKVFNLRNYYFVLDVDHIPMDGNSDNVRDEREAWAFTPEGFNIVFLGDSFTYGELLETDQTIVRVAERVLDAAFAAEVRCANFGWTSSSPLLTWRRLVAIGDKYSPDMVVQCVDMTDFQDDVKYANMLEGRGLYGVYDRIPLTLKILSRYTPGLFQRWWKRTNDNVPVQRFFPTELPLEETRPFLMPLVENLNRIHAWCAERKIPFVVFVLPRHYQYSDREAPRSWEKGRYQPLGPNSLAPFRFFEEIGPSLPYPVHSLLGTFQETEVFPTCFDHDPHWNAEGARIAGEAIAEVLREEIERAGLLGAR